MNAEALNAAIAGLSLGFGLILAIGAQNAFVLRQGLRNEYVLLVCLLCATSDALLIIAGVYGFAEILLSLPWLAVSMRWLGAVYLGYFAWGSFRRALKGEGALVAEVKGSHIRWWPIMLKTLAFTWLNPHVYVDTVLLLGSMSAQFPATRAFFAAGATTASFLFFFSLGYGGRALSPWLKKPRLWQIIDFLIGAMMLFIAIALIWPVLAGTGS